MQRVHLTCLNLTSIRSGQFWWCQECVESLSIENNDIAKADSLGPIEENNETPRGSFKRKREENRNNSGKDNFRRFLSENMKEMIELMKNTSVPKTRAPFSSFNSPETEALLDVLHVLTNARHYGRK